MTMAEIRHRIQQERNRAQWDAKQIGEGHRAIRSRGTWLCTRNAQGQCPPAVEADCPDWNGTKKEIDALIAEVAAKYPSVTEVYIAGGYDGARSYEALRGDDYQPWASSWSVTVWRRA